jgi:tRNA threonylcarbamoyladenosine biosynthesis protein TsaB
MRVLALDTTTRAGSVAVLDAGRVLLERPGDGARALAERMPAELLEALAATGLTSADIDLFAVASGPGSFTGIRIGIATIQGLAFVHGRRVAAIPALRALAEAGAQDLPAGARVGAWMDAYRRDVFSVLYEVSEPAGEATATLIEIQGPSVDLPAVTLERWATLGLPHVICGDGATAYAPLLPGTIVVRPAPLLAAFIGRLALAASAAGTTVLPAGAQPFYVRRPDVEVARDVARLKR